MKNSTPLALIAAVAATALVGGPGCEDFDGSFCADAGSAQNGLVITQGGTIEFDTTAEGLRLTVNESRSGAKTVLTLPSAERKRDEGATTARPIRPQAGRPATTGLREASPL